MSFDLLIPLAVLLGFTFHSCINLLEVKCHSAATLDINFIWGTASYGSFPVKLCALSWRNVVWRPDESGVSPVEDLCRWWPPISSQSGSLNWKGLQYSQSQDCKSCSVNCKECESFSVWTCYFWPPPGEKHVCTPSAPYMAVCDLPNVLH